MFLVCSLWTLTLRRYKYIIDFNEDIDRITKQVNVYYLGLECKPVNHQLENFRGEPKNLKKN